MMRSIIFWVVACLPAWAGDWDRVLQNGWTPPKSYFMYGYSEFTPPYYAGVRPYELLLDSKSTILESRALRDFVGKKNGRHSFLVGKYEELRHVQPGLRYLASHWVKDLEQLTAGDPPGGSTLRGIPKLVVEGSPHWPAEIAPKQHSSRIVTLTPLVLSRTQEDLGRTHPWTVYGGSEIDWEEVFWKHSMPSDPKQWWCRLLAKAFSVEGSCDLRAMGMGIFTEHPDRIPEPLRFLIVKAETSRTLRFLVTFEPFGKWAAAWKQSYREKKLQVVPHPSSLVFSSSPFFEALAEQSPDAEARQLPLSIELSQFASGLTSHTFYGLKALDVSRRKHRFQVDGANAVSAIGDPADPFSLIFEPDPVVMGLYGKPIARNVQLWAVAGPLKGQWLMHGPSADKAEIDRVRARLLEDQRKSRFHYRNYFPPMDINGYSARWYRPLVAWNQPGQAAIEIDTELLGSVRLTKGREAHWFPVDVVDRGAENEMASLKDAEGNSETTALNVQKLVELSQLLGERITEDVASALLNPVKPGLEAYASWRHRLPPPLGTVVDAAVDAGQTLPLIAPLTFSSTVGSEFERSYWKKLVDLTENNLHVHKNNTDCAATNADKHGRDEHCGKNQLPEVLTYLRNYYEKELGLTTYTHGFDWKTDFEFPWDGLKQRQHNLIVVIHGKDGKPHDEAVIMADHYDTAHMGDIYEGESFAEKKKLETLIGHRHASKGADDNHSATAALMEAARALKDLPLKKDVWLVHITGEEFPADGLGSRALCQALIENQPLVGGRKNPKVAGIYILDMVGHSTDRDHSSKEPAPAVFQIAPGRGERSAKLAVHAHRATRAWNGLRESEGWDAKFGRKRYWKRFKTPKNLPPENFPMPELGKFLSVRGELRPGWHFRSSLYNTDIQLWTDAGFPAVLFMENYDIGRQGYHDTLDNLDMIDLDYARSVVSIAIETVAQAASR